MTKRFDSVDALHKYIDKIQKDAAGLDTRIQEAGMGCLEHLDAHGDIGPCNRLYAALGQGHRKTALGQWFLAFGKMVANADQKTKKERVFNYDKTGNTDLLAAAEKPWFNFAPDKTPDEYFDLKAMFVAMMRKAAGKKMPEAQYKAMEAAAAAVGVEFKFKTAPVVIKAPVEGEQA